MIESEEWGGRLDKQRERRVDEQFSLLSSLHNFPHSPSAKGDGGIIKEGSSSVHPASSSGYPLEWHSC